VQATTCGAVGWGRDRQTKSIKFAESFKEKDIVFLLRALRFDGVCSARGRAPEKEMLTWTAAHRDAGTGRGGGGDTGDFGTLAPRNGCGTQVSVVQRLTGKRGGRREWAQLLTRRFASDDLQCGRLVTGPPSTSEILGKRSVRGS